MMTAAINQHVLICPDSDIKRNTSGQVEKSLLVSYTPLVDFSDKALRLVPVELQDS